MDKSLINFNKELIIGEIGAILGAPLIAFIFSKFVKTPYAISWVAVAGSIIGMAVFWLSTRIFDKGESYSLKELADDVKYFTPAAFVAAVIFYYPTLFFMSRSFLINNHKILYSVALAQLTAFLFFLFALNIYRFFLLKTVGKKL